MELKQPCNECPLVNSLIVSELSPEFLSVSDLLTGLTDSDYSLSCHKYTKCDIIGEKDTTEDPPLCKGALLLKESIVNVYANI